MIRIRGCNDFYDGWLAWIFRQPRPKDTAGVEGWQTAAETGNSGLMFDALLAEIELGHIEVEIDTPADAGE